MTYFVKYLDATTWIDGIRLLENHNGIGGGCGCLGFHRELTETSAAEKRAKKERLAMEGRASAAHGYAADVCVAELPNRKAYDGQITTLPDGRITCFFVHRQYRGRGVASTALKGALDAIAQSGGGSSAGASTLRRS